MQVLKSAQPIIVYFPDSSLWLSRAVSKANRKEFVHKVQEMFDQLSGPVVLICGRNKVETGSKEKEKFVSPLFDLSYSLTFYVFLFCVFTFFFLSTDHDSSQLGPPCEVGNSRDL